MKDRMSLIVFSGTVDKLMAASILATGGAAMGLEVEIFLTNWGLAAFRRGDYKENVRITKEYEDFGSMMPDPIARPDITIDREVDARGSFCPGPLMELIRVVRSAPIGSVLAVLSS